MSQLFSSAYLGLTKLLNDAGHFISPAELQGFLWGRMVAGGSNIKFEQLVADISIILDGGEITTVLGQAINGLQEMISKELTDGSVVITLLLPDDETALATRLQAIVEWGQGFLAGFGMVKIAQQESAEVLEILQDLVSITQLGCNIDEADEARSEGDYMELVEFLRLVPLLINAELTAAANSNHLIH